MYYRLENALSLITIAEQWAQEPDAWPKERMLKRLLDAYWAGEFERYRIPREDDHWPYPSVTLKSMSFCGGVPWNLTDIEDDEEPRPDHLVGLAFSDYPAAGKAILQGMEIPRHWMEAWCRANRVPLPMFWFSGAGRASKNKIGRPSNMHRIREQMISRAQAGRLALTLAQETRELSEWAARELPVDPPPPKPRSMETPLREHYWKLRGRA